jgi:hypothetical protein
MSLRDLFPSGRFSPPAPEAAIVSVESELGTRLPEQLRCLYLECDGFREDTGNAKYLLSLKDEDFIGSLLNTTRFMWSEFERPDLKPFIFFGFSSGDEAWGISTGGQSQIIAYHHHMEQEFQVVGSDIIEVFKADYARNGELTTKG